MSPLIINGICNRCNTKIGFRPEEVPKLKDVFCPNCDRGLNTTVLKVFTKGIMEHMDPNDKKYNRITLTVTAGKI